MTSAPECLSSLKICNTFMASAEDRDNLLRRGSEHGPLSRSTLYATHEERCVPEIGVDQSNGWVAVILGRVPVLFVIIWLRPAPQQNKLTGSDESHSRSCKHGRHRQIQFPFLYRPSLGLGGAFF